MDTFISKHTEVTSNNFEVIANLILNESALSINNKLYRIIEIELYLHQKEHEDLYSHRNVDQLQYGGFYFHKFKNGSYKNGTYRGLDISLGDAKTEKYCGILIRAIMNLETKDVIIGPCLSVNKILEEYKVDGIPDFVNTKFEHPLKLINHKLEKEQIYKGPRIGLQNKKSEVVKAPDFVNRDYRFLIYKDKVKKGKRSLKVI
jgi:hypothetical protein